MTFSTLYHHEVRQLSKEHMAFKEQWDLPSEENSMNVLKD